MEIYIAVSMGVSGGVGLTGDPSKRQTSEPSNGSFTKVRWLQISSLWRNLRAWLEMPWMPCNLRRCSTVVTVTMPVEIFQVGVEEIYIYILHIYNSSWWYCRKALSLSPHKLYLFWSESEWLTRDSPNKRNIDLYLLNILNVKVINSF